ncbi:MAG: hypothetical protein AAFV95_16215 [Bacteroidota bacterium]
MYQLITGTLLLSVLHAFIPHHWLPVLTIGRKEGWSLRETVYVTFLAGSAHALSTIVIGVLIGSIGYGLSDQFEAFTHWVAPIFLIAMGVFFLWQHHHHHHFHLREKKPTSPVTKFRIVLALVTAMFFSPCLEISAFYLMAGGIGWNAILMISLIYLLITVVGMVLWVGWAYKGIRKFDWHALEHNAGMITGFILILVGVFSIFVH